MPRHVGVQVAHAYAAVAQAQRAVQALGEFVLAADAARLHGEHLGRTRLGRRVHGGPDAGQPVEDADRHTLRRPLDAPAEPGVPLERGHRVAHPCLARADFLVHPAQQPRHDLLRRGRHQPPHVVGVGVQQRQLQQAGHRFRVLAGHTAAPHGPRVHPVPCRAQLVSAVRMPVRALPGHLPTPARPSPRRRLQRLPRFRAFYASALPRSASSPCSATPALPGLPCSSEDPAIPGLPAFGTPLTGLPRYRPARFHLFHVRDRRAPRPPHSRPPRSATSTIRDFHNPRLPRSAAQLCAAPSAIATRLRRPTAPYRPYTPIYIPASACALATS